MSPTPKRIPSLDGLRAVSIAMVLFSHLLLTGEVTIDNRLGRIFGDTGLLGVRVFFVISGFLITSLLLREEQQNGSISLRQFYLRRALRILPVYYLFLLVAFTLSTSGMIEAMPGSVFASATSFTTFLWGDWSMQSWKLFHTWSLSIEEQFYLLWPTLLVLVPSRKRMFLACGFVLITPAAYLLWHVLGLGPVNAHLFPAQADAIGSGCLLALLLKERNVLPFVMTRSIARAVAVVVMFIPIVGYYYSPAGWVPVTTWFGCFGSVFQAAAIAYLAGSLVTSRGGATYSFLNQPIVAWVGTLSYSLYIWQALILCPGADKSPQWFMKFPQNLAAVFILAVSSYYFVERPFLRLKTRVAKPAIKPKDAWIPVAETA